MKNTLYISLILLLSACGITKKVEKQSSQETTVQRKTVVDTVQEYFFRDSVVVVYDSVTVTPKQTTNVEIDLNRVCDSLNKLRPLNIDIVTNNASIKSTPEGKLKVNCFCEETVNRLRSKQTNLNRQHSRLQSQYDSLYTAHQSVKRENSLIVKKPWYLRWWGLSILLLGVVGVLVLLKYLRVL